MDFKKIINKLAWKPEKKYSFSLQDTNKPANNDTSNNNLNIKKNISPNINENLDYIKIRFNTLINDDIAIREFTLKCENKNYKAFLLFIDGMVDANLICNYVLKVLMLKTCSSSISNREIISKHMLKNNVVVKKVKKLDIAEYIFNSLIPENNISIKNSFNDITESVNSGNCALFVDTIAVAFDIDAKGFMQRNVSAPNNEVVIKGPQEAFVENIRTNTSLLRRIINSENLVIENVHVGKLTKTNCAICYLENIANNDLVAEVKYRISNLGVDALLSSRSFRRINYRG